MRPRAASSAGPRRSMSPTPTSARKAEAKRGDRDALQQLSAHDVGDADPAGLHLAATRPRTFFSMRAATRDAASLHVGGRSSSPTARRSIGSAKTVRAAIERMRDKTGLRHPRSAMFQFGVLSDELARAQHRALRRRGHAASAEIEAVPPPLPSPSRGGIKGKTLPLEGGGFGWECMTSAAQPTSSARICR